MIMAQRIRTIKPSFWSDEAVMGMTREARLLTIGLMSYADDDGRFVATMPAICGYLFPGDDIKPAQFNRWLNEARDSGIIHLYTVRGVTYGCLPNWHKHQKMNRHTPSSLPEPDIICATRNFTSREDD